MWQKVDRLRQACGIFHFSYLFHCVPYTPDHILIPANKKLIGDFMSGTLGTHLHDFNTIISKWLIGVPPVDNFFGTSPAILVGLLTLGVVQFEFIENYFSVHHIRKTEYFDRSVANMTFDKFPLGKALDQLKSQYRMQMYMTGSIDETSFNLYSAGLEVKFRTIPNTVEDAIAHRWDSLVPNYEYACSQKPHYDAFMYLLDEIIKRTAYYKDKLTIYQILRARRARQAVQFADTLPRPDDDDTEGAGQGLSRKARRQQRKALQQPVMVNAAHTDAASTPPAASTQASKQTPQAPANPPQQQQTRAQPRQELCHCGRSGHTPDQCNRPETWPPLPEEIRRRYGAYFTNKFSHDFSREAATNYSNRPRRQRYPSYPRYDNDQYDNRQGHGHHDYQGHGPQYGGRGGYRGNDGQGGIHRNNQGYYQAQQQPPPAPNPTPAPAANAPSTPAAPTQPAQQPAQRRPPIALTPSPAARANVVEITEVNVNMVKRAYSHPFTACSGPSSPPTVRGGSVPTADNDSRPESNVSGKRQRTAAELSGMADLDAATKEATKLGQKAKQGELCLVYDPDAGMDNCMYFALTWFGESRPSDPWMKPKTTVSQYLAEFKRSTYYTIRSGACKQVRKMLEAMDPLYRARYLQESLDDFLRRKHGFLVELVAAAWTAALNLEVVTDKGTFNVHHAHYWKVAKLKIEGAAPFQQEGFHHVYVVEGDTQILRRQAEYHQFEPTELINSELRKRRGMTVFDLPTRCYWEQGHPSFTGKLPLSTAIRPDTSAYIEVTSWKLAGHGVSDHDEHKDQDRSDVKGSPSSSHQVACRKRGNS